VLSSDGSSKLFKLEAQMRNVEKENAGLREANTILSTKLFKEMERTDTLHVTNKGLATRICKLVAFIQLREADSWGGEGGGGGAGAGALMSDRGSKLKRGKNVFAP
jgi:hypothetical protein